MSDDLATKRPSDSVYERILPFSSDATLRDTYVNPFGDLRFGKFLEELDHTAGRIAYDHSDGFEKNLTIVTAACDRIDLLAPLPCDRDIRVLGQVNHVGRSSMEIGIRLESKVGGKFRMVARAYFIMVAIKYGKGHPINRLEPETPDEKRRWNDALQRQEQRRQNSANSYMLQPPSAEEGALIHQLFLKTRSGEALGSRMGDTFRQTTVLVHPQDRNIHNKIFGGHIMRLSFEAAWSIAHIFCKNRPLFLAVDHFDFLKPVEIGSIVSFNGQVVFTGKTSFIVEIKVEVIHPQSGTTELTNVSYLTYVAVDEDRKPIPVPVVYPYTYEESLKYIDGARRYKRGKQEQARRKG